MKRIITLVISALVVIGLIILGLRIISGAVSLVGGLFNAVLGVAVVLALVAIVIWMFSYAKKNR